MKKFSVFIACLVIMALAAPSLLAQQRQQRQRGGGPGGAGRDLVSLLTQKSVQEELKLSEDQVKKVTGLAQTRRGSGRGAQNLSQEERQKRQEERAKANEKALAEILKPDQFKRAKQISWQQQGTQAFSDPEVATALKLTGDQKEKIKTIQEDARRDGSRSFQRGGNQEEARKRREALRKNTQESVMSVLTADQKLQWKELTGEPFKSAITRPGARGGNRAGRGGTPPEK